MDTLSSSAGLSAHPRTTYASGFAGRLPRRQLSTYPSLLTLKHSAACSFPHTLVYTSVYAYYKSQWHCTMEHSTEWIQPYKEAAKGIFKRQAQPPVLQHTCCTSVLLWQRQLVWEKVYEKGILFMACFVLESIPPWNYHLNLIHLLWKLGGGLLHQMVHLLLTSLSQLLYWLLFYWGFVCLKKIMKKSSANCSMNDVCLSVAALHLFVVLAAQESKLCGGRSPEADEVLRRAGWLTALRDPHLCEHVGLWQQGVCSFHLRDF